MLSATATDFLELADMLDRQIYALANAYFDGDDDDAAMFRAAQIVPVAQHLRAVYSVRIKLDREEEFRRKAMEAAK